MASLPGIATNSEFARLEPALLTVTAERIKESLWTRLGIGLTTPWRGQVFLTLHPARSLGERVMIVSSFSANGWNYQVELPDVLPRTRFMRAMTGVILLEIANRNPGARTPEIPDWLADGLSQQVLADARQDVILAPPEHKVNGLAVARLNTSERGLDFLANARQVLKNFPALTFEQLSWPSDRQINGDDDGVYRASTQLFVAGLLKLKNGDDKLRGMLENLPHFYNWQTAFLTAFHEHFQSPLDVEKWWALQVVDFVAHEPGTQWTPAISRQKLDEILSAQVEVRSVSNSLPSRTEVSLQAVIRNFDSARQTAILQTKLRDLELAQFRVAPALAVLTDGYRRAIADYLGQGEGRRATMLNKHSAPPQKAGAKETLKKLDALDTKRRSVEASIQPDQPALAPKDLRLKARP